MTQEEMGKYQEAMFLFCGGLYIRNNRDLPGIPTLPPIEENNTDEDNSEENNP